MSSTSETGHIKNVTAFNHLINACIGFGSAYAPTKLTIQIPALQTTQASALSTLDAIIAEETVIDNIINQRKALFAQMSDRATRLINALDASEASDQLVRDARTHLNKIRGKRATAPPTEPDPDNPETQTISVSQRSFDSLIQHFQSLVALVLSEPTYAPNETELQSGSLSAYIAGLQASNNDESSARIALSLAIISRNQILYTPGTGLCHIAQEVKKYIKSVFGAASPEYKLVAKIRFRSRKI